MVLVNALIIMAIGRSVSMNFKRKRRKFLVVIEF